MDRIVLWKYKVKSNTGSYYEYGILHPMFWLGVLRLIK